MKLFPIIISLLCTDLYKFSMGAVIHRWFNEFKTKWTFKCRNKNIKFTPEMIAEIQAQIDHYCTLRFTANELKSLKKLAPWISDGYLNHLADWTPKRSEIKVNTIDIQACSDCGLAIEAEGTWLNTSMYEIAILAIVNEVYFAFTGDKVKNDILFQKSTIEKFNKLKSGEYDIGTFSEFGLRRRYSGEMQDWLIKYIVSENVPGFIGTSNVYLAAKYGVKACGTQAHEYIMCVGQGEHAHNPAYSNKYALRYWREYYGVKNGIALTDTITTDCFLRDFTDEYAATFSGVRHDSGDPILWGEKMIAHYKKFGIDPMTKTLLFSDSLNFEKATEIKKHFNGKAKIAFGIGTYLSNPLPNPLNIVMKVTECNGSPVAKISDVEGKGMCRDDRYVDYLKRCIEWRMTHEEA